jgi:uncharacterized protein (DUF2141 family)
MILVQCASPGNPTGGPKDEDPPKLLKASPENASVNFKAKEITIEFDEYIKLKDIQKNFMISPPVDPPPSISPMGTPDKEIVIKFKKDLSPNTTYLINFGESIVDNNEGNKYGNLQFVFATGNQIDSLKLQGKVSFEHFNKPPKRTIVVLYKAKNFNDSLVFKKKPYYVAVVDKAGNYNLTHLKSGKYKIFAFADIDGNYQYSPGKEAIAFLENSIEIPKDTLVNLRVFQEKERFKFGDFKQLSKNHVTFTYKGIPKYFKIIDTVKLDEQIQFYKNKMHHLWYKTQSDSIHLLLKTDTYTKVFHKKRKDEADSLLLTFNRNGKMGLRDTLILSGNIPLHKLDSTKVQIRQNDSISIDFQSKMSKTKQFLLFFDQKAGEKYKITVLPNAITDFLGNQNKDTISAEIKLAKVESYGNLIIKIKGIDKAYFVELLNTQNRVIRKSKTTQADEVSFTYLAPQKYTIRVVIDDNNNNKSDTGNYLKHKQAEKTIDFSKPIDVRANWDINQTFEVK